MRVVGIMVIDRDPLESRPQVMLHPGDQRSRVGAEVEACRLLWGDYEFEEPSVARGLQTGLREAGRAGGGAVAEAQPPAQAPRAADSSRPPQDRPSSPATPERQ